MGLAQLMVLVLVVAPEGLEPIGRLDHPEIREASGIVASRLHPGTLWVHNDSGNPPALFAVRRDGAMVREFRLAVPNVDWEDIAADAEGHLFIGETGNNGGRLPLRALYRIDEPDPDIPEDRPLPVSWACYYRFSPGDRFDCEGLVIDRDRALLIAKRRDRREAEVFAVPLDPPALLIAPVLPEEVGTLPGFTEPVTGADLSADGSLLAACSTSVARVYQRGGDDSWTLLGEVRYAPGGIEAIGWDGADLILASEGRGLYRIAEASWRGGGTGRHSEPEAAGRP